MIDLYSSIVISLWFDQIFYRFIVLFYLISISISTLRGQYLRDCHPQFHDFLDSDIFCELFLKLEILSSYFEYYPESTSCSKAFVYALSGYDPESTSYLSCFVIPNLPHTSISFFDYMWSQIDHTLVKEGQMYAPWNGRLDFGPHYSIYQFINFPESMVCNFLLLNQVKSISLIKFDYFISKVDHFILSPI